MILTRGVLNATLLLGVITFLLIFLYNQVITDGTYVDRARDPWKYGFPDWYGYHERGTEERDDSKFVRKERILILTNLTGTSSSQLSFMNDLMTHPRLHLDVSIRTLLDLEFPNPATQAEMATAEPPIDWCAYDTVWTIGGGVPNIHSDFKSGCHPIWIHETGHEESPTAAGHHHDADITLLNRPRDMVYELQYEKLLSKADGEFQIGLMGNDLKIFSLKRPLIDLMTSSDSPEIFYPSRRLTRWSRHSITYFTRHKGARGVPRSWQVYRLQDTPRAVLDWPKFWSTRTPTLNETFSMQRQSDRDKSEVMRNSWICIFDDFDEGYLSELMVEAMMAGCVVAAVSSAANSHIKDLILPVQTEPFGSLSPIDDATSGQRIQAAAIALQPNLRHMDRRSLAMKMVKSVAYAYDRLDHERKRSTVENLVQRWREGERGYLFPEGINLDCHSGSKASRPPWCST